MAPQAMVTKRYGKMLLSVKYNPCVVNSGMVYVGFKITSEMTAANPGMVPGTYYLRGGAGNESSSEEKTIYEANKEIIKEAFGYSTDSTRCNETSTHFSCSLDSLFASISKEGSAESGECPEQIPNTLKQFLAL